MALSDNIMLHFATAEGEEEKGRGEEAEELKVSERDEGFVERGK